MTSSPNNAASSGLLVRSCNYHLQGKALLKNVDFDCEAGQLTGIIGPSGAGKSVLLNMLTFGTNMPKDDALKEFLKSKAEKEDEARTACRPRNLLQADLFFTSVGEDGAKTTESMQSLQDFTQHCAYVPAVDAQFPTLTCREVLANTAAILSNDTPEEIADRVEALLDLLGLQKCADTKVGGYVGMKGMSGGQKKRLALGVALLREPKILYMDEPTSGLDAAAAFHVMKVIKDLAERFQLCVIATLQQPPSAVFQMLDKVLVLSKGQVAYSGARSKVLPWFESISQKQCPAGSNPADFVLDLVNARFDQDAFLEQELETVPKDEDGPSGYKAQTTPTGGVKGRGSANADMPGITMMVDKILLQWSVLQASKKAWYNTLDAKGAAFAAIATGGKDAVAKEDEQQVYEHALKAVPRKNVSTKASRLRAVMKREWKIATTDPILYLMRVVIMWFTNVFMIALWWEGRDYTVEFVMSKVWPLMMILTSNSIYSIVCVYFYKQTFPVVSQEIRNGCYSTMDYLFAVNLVAIPAHAILAAVSMYGSIYVPWYGNWNLATSPWGFITQFLLIQIFDAVARASSMMGHIVIGFGSMVQFWYASFLFCAMFLEPELVPWPFRFFTYVSPHRHAFPLFIYPEFSEQDSWEGADRCAALDLAQVALGTVTPDAACIYPDGYGMVGYKCPEAASKNFNCWGKSGKEILRSLKAFYPAVDTTDEHLGTRLIGLVAVAFYFSLVHCFLFTKNVWASAKLSVSGQGPPKAMGGNVKKEAEEPASTEVVNVDVVPSLKEGESAASTDASGNPPVPALDTEATKRQQSKQSEISEAAAALHQIRAYNPENAVSFACENLSVQIRKTGQLLVNKVSVRASGGQLFAMLGPSGAGKTTWLDAVTFNLAGNLEMKADNMLVNGRRITKLEDLQNDCVYVPQHILLIPTLTCRQNLEFTAKLVTGCTSSEDPKVQSMVDDMLPKMGLVECQDQQAGGLLGNSGLTPGQKKRLSVACALLKSPSIVLLDEPTTGLDSASAFVMMYYLRKLAAERNMLVVCTIHQPSFELYTLFDEIAILAAGNTAVCCPRSSVKSHFDSIGYPVPAMTNPAEYYLDLVNADFSSKEQQEKILASWKTSNYNEIALAATTKGAASPTNSTTSQTSKKETASAFTLFRILLARESYVTLCCDPTCYIARFPVYLFTCLFFSVAYAGHWEVNQENAMFKAWLMGWCLCGATLFAAPATLYLCQGFGLVKAEIRNGYYPAWAYLVAVTILCLPICFLLTLITTLLPVHAAGNIWFKWGAYSMSILNLTVYYIAFEFFCHLASVLSQNILVGLLAVIVYWYRIADQPR
ncbi:unnamed protein product [Amoebophrya sp. A25]|nr:unnamed protein product [Amoebophrya sp. A25]|eukprot:GSA25T00020597001.1